MVVASKMLWPLLQPDNLLLICAVVAAVLLWTPWRRLGRWLATFGAAGLFAAAMLPLGSWLAHPLETRFPPSADTARVDGVIVLGGSIRSGHAMLGRADDLANVSQRMYAFAALAQRFPAARLVFTGGPAPHIPNATSEVDEARPILAALGIDLSRVLFEPTARSTLENARASKALARPGADERWLLVTSALHMPRAVAAFRAEGWPVTAYPVDLPPPRDDARVLRASLARGLFNLNQATHEWLGLLAYRLLGHTRELLPQ
jgi:uncharacterized SAM-binding protein YcdF (DUF218 family)